MWGISGNLSHDYENSSNTSLSDESSFVFIHGRLYQEALEHTWFVRKTKKKRKKNIKSFFDIFFLSRLLSYTKARQVALTDSKCRHDEFQHYVMGVIL